MMQADPEAEVGALLARGAYEAALRVALAAYGGEIRGFVLALVRDESAASDVFADVSERLWRGLPSFRGDASFRTWAYVIARNACKRHLERAARRRERPLSDARTSQLVVRPSTATTTDTRCAQIARIRAQLSADDQALLVLRVDRGLAWEDVARVLGASDDVARVAPDDLARQSAAARKRFERIKDRLRAHLRGEARSPMERA